MHPDAHEEGGLACNDKKLLLEMREYVILAENWPAAQL
jgi:hypothetical protein